MYRMGVDLGGTKTSAAIFYDNKIVIRKKKLLDSNGDPEHIANIIAEVCRDCLEGSGIDIGEVEYIGVGCPGAVDPVHGVIKKWARYGFDNVPMAKLLYERLGRKIYIENDGNAAVIGEYIAGTGVGAESIIVMTVGTGIGGGAVVGGRLLSGHNHAAMEIGHMVIHSGGRSCPCGRTGCFEAYASATALTVRTQDVMRASHTSKLWEVAGTLDKVNGKTAFDAAALGDPAAMNIIEDYLKDLACGIINLIQIFQPEVFCISGGLSNQSDALMLPLKAAIAREDYMELYTASTNIVRSALGSDAGLYGAAALERFV